MTVEVRADVKIVPAKRKAAYDVPVESDRPKPRVIAATVNAKDVTLSSNWPSAHSGRVFFPKTLEAADALIALAIAVRAELAEQGVES